MELTYLIEFHKNEADMTQLNNLMQKREMATLLAALNAMHRLEIHRAKGRLEVNIPPLARDSVPQHP